MRSASPSVGALAAALAGAQRELVNPEKSAAGLLPSERPGGESRSFRYATLSNGLDLARQALGAREIALLQTTYLDGAAGWLQLQSVLVHASGEWISSDWPIGPLSLACEPHRLGAAMTYARRYALFALIGIAGEDDLDAPDLEIASTREGAVNPTRPETGREATRAVLRTGPSGPQPSPQARLAQLMAEIVAIGSEEELWRWALYRIALKDTLPRELAEIVEQGFARRTDELQRESLTDELQEESSVEGDPEDPVEPSASGPETSSATVHGGNDPGCKRIEIKPEGDPLARNLRPASSLPVSAPLRLPPPRPVPAKPLRLRDKAHLKAISHYPCLVCGRSPADPHHLRFAQPAALGRKSSDEFVVPLCRLHHDELHRHGDEKAFWESIDIDPLPVALELWAASRQGASPEPASPPEVSSAENSAGRRDRRRIHHETAR